MIARVLLAAILARIAVGFLNGVIQQVRVTPLTLAAVHYEGAMPHGHETEDAAAPAASAPDHSKMAHRTNPVMRLLIGLFASIAIGTSKENLA